MKKVFCLIIFCATFFFSTIKDSFAQITFETNYPYAPSIIYFNHMGQKWLAGSTSSDIYLYNLDHSLFRHIIVPSQTTLYTRVFYISDDLFDNDSTNIEYLVSSQPSSSQRYVKVYREDGTLLFSRDSVVMINSWPQYILDYGIFPTDSGTKMVLANWTATVNYSEIYSLPGRLACPMICSDFPYVSGIDAPLNQNDFNLRNPYPNPATGQTHIPYELPQGETSGEIIFYDLTGAEVKRYKVDSTFKDLILSTADLAAGSYYYQLQTSCSKSEGKKLVVIK